MMTTIKSDCRKFSANIFNKTKCQNCFRGKDVHSAEALESNRATRKICLCGYLFVAPDWDFSLPANRNKRWQRRWFVLYDDGELVYSVDECPETVPQAVIDMNCVIEVSDAEAVTGNQYSLAITLPEKIHFIKGTNKEETKKWYEVLSRFPQNTVCGKYKRNATFPAIKSVSSSKSENNFTDLVNKQESTQAIDCSKSSSYINCLKRNLKKSSAHYELEDAIPTKDTCYSGTVKSYCKEEDYSRKCNGLPKDTFGLLKSMREQSQQSCSANQVESPVSPPLSKPYNIRESVKEAIFSKRVKHESKERRKYHSRSDVTPMIPSLMPFKGCMNNHDRMSADAESIEYHSKPCHYNPVYVLMSDVPSGKKYETCEKFVNTREAITLQRQSSYGNCRNFRHISTWRDDHHEMDTKYCTIHKSASVPSANKLLDDENVSSNLPYLNPLYNDANSKRILESFLLENARKDEPDTILVRGDPDGCNLDSLPSCGSLNTDCNSEAFSLKKGWLVKQEHNKWNKHWFVLRNLALTYYVDPIAEDAGILDGVVDLRKVQSVYEMQSSSGHTFCIAMKDASQIFLSAVTSKMRNNWIKAIVSAAKLKTSSEDANKQQKHDLSSLNQVSEALNHSLKRNPSVSSADSDSIVQRRQNLSKHISAEEDEPEITRRRTPIALPPSPPVARTAISKVKERARSRSRSRTPRFNSTEVHEAEPAFLDSDDDGMTDHSSSSLSTTPVSLSKMEKQNTTDAIVKSPESENKSERRRSLKLSSSDILPLTDKHKKALEIKDKLEDSSWTIWLDVSKFCKEVEAKLDDIEKVGGKELPPMGSKRSDMSSLSSDKKKEASHLVTSLMKVEKRLHKVHDELEKAKSDLLLNTKEDLGISLRSSKLDRSAPSVPHIQEAEGKNGAIDDSELLSQQLSKMKEENRRLKQDLKAAHGASDKFELDCFSLKHDMKQKQELHQSQTDLMVARVEDLTTKLLNSEKNVRQLRQRVMKLEQRQERRRSSLKGKEALTLSKEYESKLCELEEKIGAVEVALKASEDTSNVQPEKDSTGKDSTNLIMRLHSLDKKVKDVSHIVDKPAVEETEKAEDFEKPKICLQVKLDEEIISTDANENWNSLSLSTSLTDLTSPNVNEDKTKNKTLGLSIHDCLESFNYKVTSMVSWLKTTLQLMSEEGSSNASNAVESNSHQAENDLRRLTEILDQASNSVGNMALISQDIGVLSRNLLYKIVLLQEIVSIIFRMSNSKNFKAIVFMQHLLRMKQVLTNLETFIAQKTTSVCSDESKMSLCNIIGKLFFHQVSFTSYDHHKMEDVVKMHEEVEDYRKRLQTTVFLFRDQFLENFCTTISELSENALLDKSSTTLSSEKSPVGQKQFLSHINHIVHQVSQSFTANISKSVNGIYFLRFNMLHNDEKWSSRMCKCLQQELVNLSSEIKSVCLKKLRNDFYSGSKCGVLVKYMHCSIWELAQIISINSIVESTTMLIKEGISEDSDTPLEQIQEPLIPAIQDNFDNFQQYLLQRTMSAMSNIPLYSNADASWTFCNSSEVNVAQKSVSSLLCFKQKLKSLMEKERNSYQTQIGYLNQQMAALLEEQKRCQNTECKSCTELGQEVSYLQAELDESRAIARSGTLCEKCSNLKAEIQKMMEQHERNSFIIQRLDEQEENWKQKVQEIVKEKEQLLAEEKMKFEKEQTQAQEVLKNMKKQYEKDLLSLQSVCMQKLSKTQSDALKCRYSSEVDQLKLLCKKGLEAMEVSHRKIIAELEQRHQREMESSANEREKVLAEEAHATALALAAVRKAHREELEMQMQVFKDDFMQRMNARFETEAFKKGFESEMSKITQEILAITEKYSVKCLENISLQENLESITEELKTSNSQVFELQAMNKQLQSRLVSVSMQKLEELV